MIDPKDAAALSAAFQQAEAGTGADRAAKQLIAQLASAKEQIGLEDSEIFEAIAEGTSAKDPLYYTARILQYVSEYLTPWAVPIVLGLGFWKAFDLARELTDVVGDWWKTNVDGPAPAVAGQPAKKKDHKAYFMNGMTAASVVPVLQTGLLAVLPPYASLAISRIVNKPTTTAANVPPAGNKFAPGFATTMQPTVYQPQQQQQPMYYPPQDRPSAWEQVGLGIANKAGEALIGSVFGGGSNAFAPDTDAWFDARVRDARVRDARGPSGVAPTNLGLAQ